jgi:spermidine/putrescine transport system permease protein
MARRRSVGDRALALWAVIALAYLFVPIVIIVLFSFNDPIGPRNYEWNKFSLKAWAHPFLDSDLAEGFRLSLVLAALATVIAVVLGTAMSLALVKYRFKGKGIVNTLLVLPLTMPEVVLGFSLLTLFASINLDRGFLTMLIAHVMFSVSYVATTVKARIRGFDWRLEEAAADLGSSPWRTFQKVTFPIIAPGVFAAALLTFALSLDDFIITYLNSGDLETFPITVWLKRKSTVPPQINVFGTSILLVSALLAGAGLLLQRRRERLMLA